MKSGRGVCSSVMGLKMEMGFRNGNNTRRGAIEVRVPCVMEMNPWHEPRIIGSAYMVKM